MTAQPHADQAQAHPEEDTGAVAAGGGGGAGGATGLPPWARLGGPSMAATLLGTAALLWFAVELLRGFFWQDDFVFLYLADTVPLHDLLLRGYNGHLQPGTFLFAWLVAQLAPLSWPAAALPLALLHGAALVLLWLFLLRLYGERWAIVVPFVAVALSPLTFVLSLWWAFALLLLPVELALFGALHAQLAHLQRPAAWPAVRGVLFVAFGLAFGEKAALIPFVLLGLTMALAGGGPRARVLGTLRRHARLWLAYLVLLAGYVVLHAWRAPLPDGSVPGVDDLGSLTRSMVGDGLLPALFGGPWNGDWVGFLGLAPPPTAVLAVSWTLFGLLVLLGLWLGRARAVVAWLVLGGYLLVSIVLVGSARLGPWGAIIGTDPRYVADSLPVAVVCAALAVLRPRSAIPAAGTPRPAEVAGPERARTRLSSPRLGILALVPAVALTVGAGASITGALPELRHQSARDYVENVQAAHRLEPDLVLYDSPVPPEVVLPLFDDSAMVSRALCGLGITFDQPAEDLRMLDATGTPRKIGLVDTVASRTAPVPSCGYPAGPQITRVPLTQRAEGSHLVVQLGYYTQLPTDGTVSTPSREFRVRFQAGLHLLSVVVDGPFTEILVQADAPVCVTNALVGLPLPHPS